ncbi:MAG: DUF1501 domain-containing protein [Actinobacteria bacterium]|nr:DUF1501 domain-containing protein [Actinomycetota bacterium]
MDTLSRRRFLQLTGGAAIAAAAPLLSIDSIAQAALIRPLPLGTPIFVLITLYGGNDGLNTVIPYQDSAYYQARPEISYQESELLPIGEGLALNGSMSGIKALWESKKVAIIRGVGYPQPDRSHFSSMAIWQSASPISHVSSGWLGRWLDRQESDPMLAISLGSVLPPLLAGSKVSGSALPLGGLVVPSGKLALDCQRISAASGGDSKLMASAATSLRNLFELSSTITPILKEPAPSTGELPTANGGNAGGNSDLQQQLDVVAKLIAAGSPTRIWSVSLGGFDTHANEKGAQSILLGNVSDSIARFMKQMQLTGRGKDIVVMAYSEFGRRVKGNASQGTDHGTSGPVFLIGDRVNGGFYGDQPSMRELVAGDLAVTTDFRDIYGTLLEGVLKTPASDVLGKWSGRSNFLRSA